MRKGEKAFQLLHRLSGQRPAVLFTIEPSNRSDEQAIQKLFSGPETTVNARDFSLRLEDNGQTVPLSAILLAIQSNGHLDLHFEYLASARAFQWLSSLITSSPELQSQRDALSFLLADLFERFFPFLHITLDKSLTPWNGTLFSSVQAISTQLADLESRRWNQARYDGALSVLVQAFLTDHTALRSLYEPQAAILDKASPDLPAGSALFRLLALLQIEEDLQTMVRCGDINGLSTLEKMLIPLMGYQLDGNVTDLSIRLLNQMYDGHSWQQSAAFQPQVRTVDDDFSIEIAFDSLVSLLSRLFVAKGDSPFSDQSLLEKSLLDGLFLQISLPLLASPEAKPLQYDFRSKLGLFRPLKSSRNGEQHLELSLDSFEGTGYYDWNLLLSFPPGLITNPSVTPSSIQTTSHTISLWKVLTENRGLLETDEESRRDVRQLLQQVRGRYIVQPAIREDMLHEVIVDLQDASWDHTGSLTRRGSFKSITGALEAYKKEDSVSMVYLMGALERADFGTAQPFASIDRSQANGLSGGQKAFETLMKQAKDLDLKVLVDATPHLSVRGFHRKYNKCGPCWSLDQFGLVRVALGTDGSEHVWPDCCLLNYRLQATWDQFLQDIESWAERGVSGVRIDCGHCSPMVMPLNLNEILRRDNDGSLHYSPQQILDGLFVLDYEGPAGVFDGTGASGSHAYGGFGAVSVQQQASSGPPRRPRGSYEFKGFSRADRQQFTAPTGFYESKACQEGYANPFFIRTTRRIWSRFPRFLCSAEVYWQRESAAIRSGLVPFASGLNQALGSLFGAGLDKDGKASHLANRTAVDVIYGWFSRERDSYPPNSIVLYASASHYSPYPLAIYGRGAWTAADLLYFLPDVPGTLVGEQQGWLLSYSIHQDKFMAPQSTMSSYAATTTFGVPLSNLATWSSQQMAQHEFTKGIHGHYIHRAKLRQEHAVLRQGGLVPLYARYSHPASREDPWHDRVFAFARFASQELAIIAINFNDAPSDVYIDMEPLRDLYNILTHADPIRSTTASSSSSSSGLQEGVPLEAPAEVLAGHEENYVAELLKRIGNIYCKSDLINPTAEKIFFSEAELLNEKQYVRLNPYESFCWKITPEPPSSTSNRVLFEHSLKRLHKNLEAGVDPNHNLIYTLLIESLERSPSSLLQCIQQLHSQIPQQLIQDFPHLLHRIFHRYAQQHKCETRIVQLLKELRSMAEAETSPA
eukprot:TRINITY_DN9738_c1_g1_i1.p1 TRINITY_DN9738_c1_g1~~TRINITY_DN9738_c1_g1_i1.p1  ORF type:complete len:1214 (+),score=495.01 TRINITY_DN9738_c1_g1_i1:23-3643(+)